MINSLILFGLFILPVSLILTLISIVNKETSAFGELRNTVQSLLSTVASILTTAFIWIRSNISNIINYGVLSLVVTGALVFAIFFISFEVSRNTQIIATGVNNTLAGPFQDALNLIDNVTGTLAEVSEPIILSYDGYIGLIRVLTKPAIDIALECDEFSWTLLLDNTLDVLAASFTSFLKYVTDLLDPTSPTAGYFDFFSILHSFAMSIANTKEVLKCECRLLSFYFEYMAAILADDNLWMAIDRVLNFLLVAIYQIAASLLQFVGFFLALITGQWADVWAYFFDNAYGYPDYFELSTIIRDAVVYIGSFYDHISIEVLRLFTSWIPFDISSLYPEFIGPIIGNFFGVPIQIVGEFLQIRTRFLTVVAGNYGPKLHDDFDVLKIGMYQIMDAIADVVDIKELPTLPEVSCAIRHMLYGLVLIWEGLAHTAINLYTVLVQSFWSFEIPVAFGDQVIDSRILAIVDDIKENATAATECIQNITNEMQQEELGIAFIETAHWYNSNVQFFVNLLKYSRLSNWTYYTSTTLFRDGFEQKYNETVLMGIAWGNFFRSLSILDNCTANIIPHVNTSVDFPYPSGDVPNDVFCCFGGLVEAVIKELAGIYRIVFRIIYELSRNDDWTTAIQIIANGSVINITKEIRDNLDRIIESAACEHPLVWIVEYTDLLLPNKSAAAQAILTCHGGPLNLADLLHDTATKFFKLLGSILYALDFILNVVSNYVSTDESLVCQNQFADYTLDDCFCHIIRGTYRETVWRLMELVIDWFRIAECITNSLLIGDFITVTTDTFGPDGTFIDIVCNTGSLFMSLISNFADSFQTCKMSYSTAPEIIGCVLLDYVQQISEYIMSIVTGLVTTVIEDMVNFIRDILSATVNFFYCAALALLKFPYVGEAMSECSAAFVATFTTVTIGNFTYNTTVNNVQDNCNRFFAFRPSGPLDGYLCVKDLISTACVMDAIVSIFGYCHGNLTTNYTSESACDGCWEAIITDFEIDTRIDPTNCSLTTSGGACCYASGTQCIILANSAQCDTYNGEYTAGVSCASGACAFGCLNHTSEDVLPALPMPCEDEFFDLQNQTADTVMYRLVDKNYKDCMWSYNWSRTINSVTGYALTDARFLYDSEMTYKTIGNFMTGISYAWSFYLYRNYTPEQFFSIYEVDDTIPAAQMFVTIVYRILFYIDTHNIQSSSTSWLYYLFTSFSESYTFISQLFDMASLFFNLWTNTTLQNVTFPVAGDIQAMKPADFLTPEDIDAPTPDRFYDKLVQKPWFIAVYNYLQKQKAKSAKEVADANKPIEIIKTVYNKRMKWRLSGSDPLTEPYPQYTEHQKRNLKTLDSRIARASATGDVFAMNYWTDQRAELFPSIPSWVSATNDCATRDVWDVFGRSIGTCADDTVTSCVATPLTSYGSCCLLGGDCVIAPNLINCTSQGGLFTAGATCDPDPEFNLTICASPLLNASYGACCYNKTCRIGVAADCPAGGIFNLGMTCSSSGLDASCEYCTSVFWPDIDITPNVLCPELALFYTSPGYTMTPCDERSCYSVDGSSTVGSCMTQVFDDFNPFPDSLRNPVCTCNMTGVTETTACCLLNGTSYFTNNTVACNVNNGTVLQNEPLASCTTLLLIESDPANYGACCESSTCSVVHVSACTTGLFTPGHTCAAPDLPAECDHCAAQGCRECAYFLAVVNEFVDILLIIRNQIVDVAALQPQQIPSLPMRPQAALPLPTYNASMWLELWNGLGDPDFDFSDWLFTLLENLINFVVQEWFGYSSWDIRSWIDQDLTAFFDTTGTDPASFVALFRKYTPFRFIRSCDPVSDIISNTGISGLGLVWAAAVSFGILMVIAVIVAYVTKSALMPFMGRWMIIYFILLWITLSYDVNMGCFVPGTVIVFPVSPYVFSVPLPMVPYTIVTDFYEQIVQPLLNYDWRVCPDCPGPEFPICHLSPFYFTTGLRNLFYALRTWLPRIYCEFDNTHNPLLYPLIHTIKWVERQYDFSAIGGPTCADLLSNPDCTFWLMNAECPGFTDDPEFRFCFRWTILNFASLAIIYAVGSVVSLLGLLLAALLILAGFWVLKIFWLLLFGLASLLNLSINTASKKRQLYAQGLLKKNVDYDAHLENIASGKVEQPKDIGGLRRRRTRIADSTVPRNTETKY